MRSRAYAAARQPITHTCRSNTLSLASGSRDKLQWRECLAKLDLVAEIARDYSLQFSNEYTELRAGLEAWSRTELELYRQDCECRSLIAQLHAIIEQDPADFRSEPAVTLSGLRARLDSLQSTWEALRKYKSRIPGDIEASHRTAAAGIAALIGRLELRLRRRKIVAWVAALALLVTPSFLFYHYYKDALLASALAEAESQLEYHRAESILQSMSWTAASSFSPAHVRAKVRAAETFVLREATLLRDFESKFAQFQASFTRPVQPSQISQLALLLASVQAAHTELAPDLRADLLPRVRKLEDEWRQALSQAASLVADRLEQILRETEPRCTALSYKGRIEDVASQISSMSNAVAMAHQLRTAVAENVDLPGSLLAREEAVTSKYNEFAQEWDNLNRGTSLAGEARTFDDYSAAIAVLASSKFSSAQVALAASTVQSLRASGDGALAEMLGLTNRSGLRSIRGGATPRFIPKSVLAAETNILASLSLDPAVSGRHRKYRLWLDHDGLEKVDWVVAGSFESAQGWRRIKAWTPSDSAVGVTFEDRDYGYFDGNWKLSPTKSVYRLEFVSGLSENSAFSALPIASVWPGGGPYAGPMLSVLDALKESSLGSSLFRAYMFCSLVEFMEYQPESWGLSFCPSARLHCSQLQRLAGSRIASGDWLLSSATARSQPLDRFFADIKAVSYAAEAQVNFHLAAAAAEEGLTFAGFVGLDGHAVICMPSPPSDLWAYGRSSMHPVRLGASCLPMSPIFGLASSTAEYSRRAGIRDAIDPKSVRLLYLFTNVSEDRP